MNAKDFLKQLKEKLEKSNRENGQKVSYNGQEYYLEDLYQVIRDEEKHICVLETQNYSIPSVLGEIEYDYHDQIPSSTYVDIVTGKPVCYMGKEKEYGLQTGPVSLEEFEEFTKQENTSIKR